MASLYVFAVIRSRDDRRHEPHRLERKDENPNNDLLPSLKLHHSVLTGAIHHPKMPETILNPPRRENDACKRGRHLDPVTNEHQCPFDMRFRSLS